MGAQLQDIIIIFFKHVSCFCNMIIPLLLRALHSLELKVFLDWFLLLPFPVKMALVTNQELWFGHALSCEELTVTQDAQIRFSKELTSEVQGLTFKEQWEIQITAYCFLTPSWHQMHLLAVPKWNKSGTEKRMILKSAQESLELPEARKESNNNRSNKRA